MRSLDCLPVTGDPEPVDLDDDADVFAELKLRRLLDALALPLPPDLAELGRRSRARAGRPRTGSL